MKLTLIVALVIIATLGAAQDGYRVIKTEGCIRNQKDGSCLTKNTTLNLSDSIYFRHPDDFAVLVNQQGNWLTLKVLDTTGYRQGKVFCFKVSETIKPNSSDTTKLATRGTNQMGTNVKALFGADRFTVIGDEARLTVNSRDFTLSKDKFFVLEYALDTFKIAKRLGFRDQVVRIQKNNLSEFNGTHFDQSKIDNMNLYYYEPQTKNAEHIASFDLLFVTNENLFAEFDEVYNNLPDKNSQTVFPALEKFFNTCYGNTDPKMLKITIESYIEKKLTQ